jgi:PAS domain S-box-containing protein
MERERNPIIDAIPTLVWSALPDGSADFFNRHYLDYAGFTQEQAAGTGWTAAVHPDDLPGLVATWQRILAAEQPGEAEARLRRRDGAYRWFLFRANPLRDESGRVVKWYGTNTDIDDRKRAEVRSAGSEDALRRAYEFLAEAQRVSRTGSFITDLLAEEHNWSEELYRIFGIDPATRVSVRVVRDLVDPEDLPAFDAGIERSTKGADFDLVFRIRTPGGSGKYLHAVARVIEHSAGRPVFLGAIQDVTESKLAEDALNRARAELARVSRVVTLGALTASIAHEINNPLSGIVTNAAACLRMLAVDPPDLEGARDTARRTIRDGRRASSVVTRLRALFANKPAVAEPVDLNDATREVVALSRSELQRAQVVVRLELSGDLPPVAGDRVQLQQVVLNLLLNAADAMNDVDDRPRELRITTGRDADDQARLSMCDSGIGIDAQDASRLFDPFYTTKTGGMGMGLWVSRSIIESHGGRLWATPNDGKGATFSFTIPRVVDGPTFRDTSGRPIPKHE